MSPLAKGLLCNHGPSWRSVWAALTTETSQFGFSGMIHRLFEEYWRDLSDFGRRRAGDLLAGLATLDHQGGVSASEAADWMERLELSQSPGLAAVQVMTIHKAKGLGFDVVILPEIPDGVVPQANYFEVAEGEGWLTQTPPKWSRAIIPELTDTETRWSNGQRYEAFCMLYVALTRAKRGLYVLLEPPAKSSDPDKPSLVNWLTRSLALSSETPVLHETGDDNWITTVLVSECSPEPASANPAAPTSRRDRMSPSGTKSPPIAGHSPAGMKFGTIVHALLEQVGWIDESLPALPDNDAGNAVARILRNPALKQVFERGGRNMELFREQAMDWIHDGKAISGVIDRLHVHRNPQRQVTRVEIIDFNTDAIKDSAELAKRYSQQMEIYRQALQNVHPKAEIDCLLLSVKTGTLIAI